MSKHVVIKHNRYGMELVLDSEISFEKLLEAVSERFQASGDFFKDRKMAVSFKGRKLSEEETMSIVDTIMANSSIQIVAITDHDSELEKKMERQLQTKGSSLDTGIPERNRERQEHSVEEFSDFGETDNQYNAEFYRGNLRSGQVLECSANVTLVGDVNPGAKIISAGNIVVLGALKGNAHAGINGNDNCFIFALDMNPIQLQIGQYYAKSPDKEAAKRRILPKRKTEKEEYCAKIATAQEGTICIESMKKTMFRLS